MWILDDLLPFHSPLRNPLLGRYFLFSISILHATYHGLANTLFLGNDPIQLKKRAWILTTVNAFVMTAASIPFLVELLWSGFDLHAVKPRTKDIVEPMSCFFVAYLLSDLGLGSLYYRKLINLSSGWIHHTAYTFLFAFWLHKGWGHIAIMACIFELPTFVMGIASLHAPLRSNSLFTGTFFFTRIFFHFGLLCATMTSHGRSTQSIDGSWGPAISVLITYPMHLFWGFKCITSVRRRMRKRQAEARRQREAQKVAEKEGFSYFISGAGQLLNGLPAPDTSSALNTPATTPGSNSSGERSALLSSAFARVADTSRVPINLFIGRRTIMKPEAPSKSQDTSAASISSVPAKLAKTVSPDQKLHPPFCQPLTAPVPPHGATEADREPFLAIRSPAEAQDRARRLVADAVRKAWSTAPESWRRQFEAEMGEDAIPSRARAFATNRRATDAGTNLDTLTSGDNSRLHRGKTAARRAFFRALRRAVHGRRADDEDEVGRQGITGAKDRRILEAILKLSGLPLPPDLVGQEYNVREYPVERDIAGGRRKRIIGQIRRRMEVARREVVVV